MTTNESDAPVKPSPRTFLVVVDDTEEWTSALRYACVRARHTGGRVALLNVIEPTEFQQWMAVEEVIRDEKRQEAEQLLQKVAKEVNALTGTVPVIHVREGKRRDELLQMINEEPAISILVLCASVSNEGPGPLISYLTGKGINRLRIPVTIVPGGLTPEQIEELA
jgi:nucleotide-binding universal stress UspA family protein